MALHTFRATFNADGYKNGLTSALVDGVHWYKARQAAELLGYKKPQNAIRDHVGEHDKTTLRCLTGGENIPHPTNGNAGATVYITEAGLKRLVTRSQLPGIAEVAKLLGIKDDTRYLRKEIETVEFIQCMLTQAMIPFEFQKRVANYKVDLYLPSQKLAIEIDEHGHLGRDQAYEHAREQCIRDELGCDFFRINPDAADFKLSSCIGRIVREIRETASDGALPSGGHASPPRPRFIPQKRRRTAA